MEEREEVKINIGGRGEEKGKRMKREKRKGRGVKEESEEKKEGKGRGKGGDWRERGERRWRGKRTEKLHWRNLVLRVHCVKDTKFIVALW